MKLAADASLNEGIDSMPDLKLDGPHPLDHETIDRVVAKAAVGVFVIGNTGQDSKFYIDRVGRSDTNLRQALYDCIGTDSQFKFRSFATPAEAFALECRIFHEIRPPMTIVHPEPPAGRPLNCPYCQALRT